MLTVGVGSSAPRGSVDRSVLEELLANRATYAVELCAYLDVKPTTIVVKMLTVSMASALIPVPAQAAGAHRQQNVASPTIEPCASAHKVSKGTLL
jgi:hypothetical protein